MDNPFGMSRRRHTPESHQEVDPDNKPVLICKVCRMEIERSDVDGEWVHSKDEKLVSITTGEVIRETMFDHVAQPDFIEGTVIE